MHVNSKIVLLPRWLTQAVSKIQAYLKSISNFWRFHVHLVHFRILFTYSIFIVYVWVCGWVFFFLLLFSSEANLMSVHPSVCLSVCLSVRLSVHPSVRLSVGVSAVWTSEQVSNLTDYGVFYFLFIKVL